MTKRARLTPLGMVARGAAAGAAGTVAMDPLWFSRYRSSGGDNELLHWEFALNVSDWDEAPTPAQFGRNLIRGFSSANYPPSGPNSSTTSRTGRPGRGGASYSAQ